MTYEWQRDEYLISDDPARLDLRIIQGFLRESYWASGIPLEVVEKSIAGSLPFGVYRNGQQIGFARIVTDYATFAYLADVFVLTEYRGKGLAKWLMQVIISHPELQGLRRWLLATRDAQGLYRQVGFTALTKPETLMERVFPDIYRE